MSKAVRAVTSQRGRDPRDFALIAFGGAGPAYAAAMAAEFEIDTVVVPPSPGLFSAVGLLVADVQQHAVTSLRRRTNLDPADLTATYHALEDELRERFGRDGYPEALVILDRFADARYRGQSSELRVPIRPGRLDREALDELYERFDLEHERTFGHRGPRDATEVLNLRVRARYVPPGSDPGELFAARPLGQQVATASTRSAYFGPELGLLETPVTSRWALAGTIAVGPLIIEDMDATTVVPPGWNVRLDDLGNLFVERPR
jgi:N-methylhydantoinase A